MTAKNNFEHKGNFARHPFAELLAEIVQAELSGSLRISLGTQKTVIYFRSGDVVYAVSNSKAFRLFNILLRKNRIDTKVISKHPNFANDVEFAAILIAEGILTKKEADDAVASQIEDVVVDALSWTDGEWTFSPLARIREDLTYPAGIHRILANYARYSSAEHVSQRFKSVRETFSQKLQPPLTVDLQPHESFILSRFEHGAMTIEQIRNASAMPESGMLQALYVLWLGGFLMRHDWNAAFSQARIDEILGARVSRVKAASDLAVPADEPVETVSEQPAEVIVETEKLHEVTITLPEYLERVEKAETHYDILGIASNAPITAIKNAYFSLAKLFHPDRYHREEAGALRRIQLAFTELAHAYETLKTKESREGYDYKMRKEIETREKRRAAGQPVVETAEDRKAEQGLESFEQGLNMLNEEEYAAAAAFLGRAVHYNPQNPLYHAYYGKALSADEKQRHKAESEMQMAAKLDPTNPKIRLMLAEFFIDMNMMKRAEGELKRFLEIAPNNKEAQAMLARI